MPNAAGGIKGRKLDVVVEDFQESNLKRAASAAQKLIAVDKVSALLTNWSEDAEVVAPIAAVHGLVSMTLGAGGPSASRFGSTAFRATSLDAELAEAAVRSEWAHGSRRGCLAVANTGYYVDISKTILAAWQSAGDDVAYKEFLSHGTTEVLAIATNLRKARCDSIFLWAAPATIGPLISELRN